MLQNNGPKKCGFDDDPQNLKRYRAVVHVPSESGREAVIERFANAPLSP
jgi:hypothetical protein